MTYFVLVITSFNFLTDTVETSSINYRFSTYESCQIARHISLDTKINRFVIKAECVEKP